MLDKITLFNHYIQLLIKEIHIKNNKVTFFCIKHTSKGIIVKFNVDNIK
jgi:hypothetical protein